MILLVLVAVAWIVVLAPGLLGRVRDRHRAGSIDHFHHQLQMLEHAGPKMVSPAYRLHTALPGEAHAGAPRRWPRHRRAPTWSCYGLSMTRGRPTSTGRTAHTTRGWVRLRRPSRR